MNKVSNYNFSATLTRIAYTASYRAKPTLLIGMLIQTISNLQIIWAILSSGFPTSEDKETIIFHKIRDFESYITLIGNFTDLDNSIYTFLAWFIFSVYLSLYLIFMLIISWLQKREIKIMGKMEKIWAYMNIAHSKIFFFPIYSFYLEFLFIKTDCNSFDHNNQNFCGSPWFIITILFIIINLAIAILFEFFCYQTCRSKYSFAIDNNSHGLIQLTHKIVLLPLLIFMDNYIIICGFFNLVFSSAYHLFLLFRLPFYNVKALKCAIVLSTFSTTFSLILFWKNIFVGSPRIFEFIIIMVTPLFLKLTINHLSFIFRRILNLKPVSPDHIIHLANLFNDYVFGNEKVQIGEKPKFKALYACGLMTSHELGEINFEKISELKSYKERSYALVLQELLKLHKLNPSSTRILLCLIQFYIEKVKNLSSTMVYIQKIQKFSLSLPERNALAYLKGRLKRKIFQAYLEYDESMEYVSYFKHREIYKNFKQNMQKELNFHAEFWKTFSSEKVDVYQILELSKQIELLSEDTKKLLELYEMEFKTKLPIPMIIYRIYLLSIRGMPNMSQTYFERLYGQDSNFFNILEKWLKEDKVSIIVSNQKESLGTVLDASTSVKNIFNIDKESLIGRKINILMPNMIERVHDSLIDIYNERAGYALNLNSDVYCKTIDGKFILAHLTGRIYPDIGKCIGLIGNFVKKEDCGSMLFVDYDGAIVDCSKDLLETFRIGNLTNSKIKLQEISIGFEEVNKAFNIVYSHKTKPESLKKPLILTESEKFETYNYGTPLKNYYKSKQDYAEQNPINYQSTEIYPLKDYSLAKRRNIPSNSQINYWTKSDLLNGSVFTKDKNLLNLNNLELNKYFDEDQKDEEDVSTINEYKKICEQFEEGKILSFCHKYNKLGPIHQKSLQYFVKVKTFLLESQYFKVVQLTEIEQQNNYDSNKQLLKQSKPDNLKEKVIKDIKSEKEGLVKIAKQDRYLQGAENKQSKDGVQLLEAVNKRKSNQLFNPKNMPEDVKPSLFKVSSQSSGQLRGNIMIERILFDLCSQQKITPFTKAFFYAFYIAMLLVVILAAYGLIITRSSFIQIKLAAELVNMDSERLFNTVNIWARGNVLYSLITQDGEISERQELSQSMIIQGLIMKQLGRNIVPLLKTVTSDDIIIEFYRRDIFFWGDYNGYHDDSLALDVFVAINTILSPLLALARSGLNLSQLDVNGAVFGLNNTINGLLISAENELRVTQNVKTSLCEESISLMQILIIGQSLSILFTFLSLVFLIIKTHLSHKKLFKVLSTISVERIKKRENDLTKFNSWLQESPGSTRFTKQLNSFFEDYATDNKKAVRGLRNKEKRFLSRFKHKDIFLMMFGSLLFMVILSLFICTAILSIKTVRSLQYLSRISEIAENMGYQIDLISGNFFYILNFNNQSDMKVHNELKETQFSKDFQILQGVNAKFQSTLGRSDNEFYDSNIDRLLSISICEFISCPSSNKGSIYGLLGLNLQYANFISSYIQKFYDGPSPNTIKAILASYSKEVKPLSVLLKESYRFLRGYLLDDLSVNIENHNVELVVFFITICMVCGISTVLLRMLVLKRVLIFERERYKVLKLIPQKLLLENKVIFSYLKREFTEEFASINSSSL